MSEIADRIHAIREPEPAPEPTPEPVANAEPVTPAPEPVSEPEPVESVAEAPQVEDDAIEAETFADLAEHFGIDPSDLYKLKVPVNMADGSKVDVTLEDWKDGYRSAHEYQREAAKVAEQRQVFEAKQHALEQQWEQRIADAASTMSVAEQTLNQEFQSVNWNELRETDPAEWAAKRQIFSERMSALQSAKRELAQTWETQKAEQATQVEQHRAEFLGREREAMLKAIPEWADEDAAKSGRAELAGYLASNGFSDDEVAQVGDHRLVVMARKAMLYDRTMKQADATKKRVVRIGKKTVSPGTTRSKATAREDADAGLRKALKKSGRVEDAAAIIRARIRG